MSHSINTKGSWCVYVLKCRKNYLYIGITNDLDNRMKAHANGTGSKFVRAWRPFELVKTIECKDGKEARQIEYQLKQMKRHRKEKYFGLTPDIIKGKYKSRAT